VGSAKYERVGKQAHADAAIKRRTLDSPEGGTGRQARTELHTCARFETALSSLLAAQRDISGT
jgi:hypothetical protein